MIELSVVDSVTVDRTKQRVLVPLWTTFRFSKISRPAKHAEVSPTLARMVDALLNDVA